MAKTFAFNFVLIFFCVIYIVEFPVKSDDNHKTCSNNEDSFESEQHKFNTECKNVAVIGDIHGDFETFSELLKASKLVDSDLNWNGSNTTLIQLGDIFDRGPQSKDVLDLLLRLQTESENSGGNIYILWGNHELMNLFGDFRYVHENEMGFWKDYETDDLYENSLKDLEHFLLNVTENLPLKSTYYSKLKFKFKCRKRKNTCSLRKQIPKGYFGHRTAWSSNSSMYFKWFFNMEKHPVTLKIGKTLFVHAGLHHKFNSVSLTEINERSKADVLRLLDYFSICIDLGYCHHALGIKSMIDMIESEWMLSGGKCDSNIRENVDSECLVSFSHLSEEVMLFFEKVLRLTMNSIILDSEGPIWTRDLVFYDGLYFDEFDETLKLYGAEQMMIGHTLTQSYSIETSYNGKLIQMDTGLNQYFYRGRPYIGICSCNNGIETWNYMSLNLTDKTLV